MKLNELLKLHQGGNERIDSTALRKGSPMIQRLLHCSRDGLLYIINLVRVGLVGIVPFVFLQVVVSLINSELCVVFDRMFESQLPKCCPLWNAP